MNIIQDVNWAALLPYLVVGGGGLLVLLLNLSAIPGAIVFIVQDAFTPTAATGGFAGAAVWAALRGLA